MAVSLTLNVSQNIWNLDQSNLYAFVRCWAPPSDLLFVSSIYLSLMLERLHFSTLSLNDKGWINIYIVGLLFNCVVPLSVVCVLI